MGSNFDVGDTTTTLVAFILNNAASKLPIKNSDLLDALNKNAKALKQCFGTARDALKETYDITLREVPESSKSAKKFICISGTANSTHEYDAEQQRQLTLIFLVLSYIFMTERPVYENELEDFLKGLGILFDEDHGYFGANIKKLITETFVKQLYLKKEKSECELDFEVRYVYSWGFRAFVEFKELDVLKATAGILKKSPDFFVSQYNKATADEAINDEEE